MATAPADAGRDLMHVGDVEGLRRRADPDARRAGSASRCSGVCRSRAVRACRSRRAGRSLIDGAVQGNRSTRCNAIHLAVGQQRWLCQRSTGHRTENEEREYDPIHHRPRL